LNPGIYRLGSSPDADIRTPYPGISRLHARVEVDQKSVTVIDLGSTNGTWVNDVQVQTSLVFPGDKVHFGSVPFRFIANIRRKLSKTTSSLNGKAATAKREIAHQAKTGVIHWSTLERKEDKALKNKSILGGLFGKKD
jgi:pSer/pThr/pTyr-binding forkhead associated (FHA) protein